MNARLPALALTATLALAACGGGDDAASPTTSRPTATTAPATTPTTPPTTGTTVPVAIEGLQVVNGLSRDHTTGPVDYGRVPPVGGAHAGVWQNCGFYSRPVPAENAVHSLEHGAIWITYRSDLPASQVEGLRRLAGEQHVLVSPWADGTLPAPIVASAWGRQLALDSVADPRLRAFVDAFRFGAQSPEPRASCSGGTGQPG